jgi:uncharacterized protein YukE
VADKLSVHPETLLRASARFALESEQLGAALDRLKSRLGSLGDVTGDDDQGHQFAAGYDPNSAMLQQALQNLARGLGDIGLGLEVMALNYQAGDDASQVRKSG